MRLHLSAFSVEMANSRLRGSSGYCIHRLYLAWAVLGEGAVLQVADDRRSRVIFVHGTGAAKRDTALPRWWQPTSHFARQLVAKLGPLACIAKPHRWSGLNLESHRVVAGAKLLERLRRLDARGVEYHLVGHSHGGSVIWHALVKSAGAGQPLTGLRSWVTVGTPFLRFVPDPNSWWRYIALLMAIAAVAWAQGPAVEAWHERSSIMRDLAEAGWLAQAYALFTVMLLTVLLLSAATLVIQAAYHLFGLLRRARLTAAEQRAAEWYGSTWLALWHPRDEAIAGLRASLVAPLQLWPRWTTAAASQIRRFVFAAYDQGFARAVDQFVWGVGMGRLQGADVTDQHMVEARHCPVALSAGWAPLPSAICDAMTQTADAKAAATISVFRERMAAAGDRVNADEVFSGFGGSVNWQELVHTSYFEQPPVVGVIADHVAANYQSDQGDQAIIAWRRARPAGPEVSPVRRPRLLAFPINRAILSVVLTFLLVTAALSSYQASIFPYTEKYLLRQIADELKTPGLASVRAEAFGDVLIGLIALGHVTGFHEYLDRVGDNEAKRLAMDRIAYAFGRDFPNTGRFLTPEAVADLDKHFSTFPPALRISGAKLAHDDPIKALFAIGRVYPYYPGQAQILSGLIDAKQTVAPAFVADLVDNVATQRTKLTKLDVAQKEEFEKANSPAEDDWQIRQKIENQILRELYGESIAIAAVNLYAIGQGVMADRMLVDAFTIEDKKLRYCPDRPAHIRRAGALASVEAVEKVGGLCRTRLVSNDYWFAAAFEARATGHLEAARKFYDMAGNAKRDLEFSPRLWDAILLHVDLDRLDEVLTLIPLWLNRVRRGPEEAMHGRVVKIVDLLKRLANTLPADRARIEAASKTIVDTAQQTFEKAIADPFFSSRVSKRDIVVELASIQVAFDRKPEARRLADKAAADADHKTVSDQVEVLDLAKSRREEERAKRAGDSALSGMLYSITGDRDMAIRRLREAIPLIEGIWRDDTYEVGCTVYAATFGSHPDIARRAFAVAVGQATREPQLPRRTTMLANLAFRAAMVGDFRQSLSLMRSAGHPFLTLSIYSLVLDRIVRKNDPDIYKRWGFDKTTWHQVPAAFLKVDQVPACGSD